MKLSRKDVSLLVDDVRIVGVNSLRVELTGGNEADIFDVTVADPRREHFKRFRSTDGRRVDVSLAGRVCFRGFCDEARFGVVPDGTISLNGRDFSGLLIDEVVSDSLAAACSGVTASAAVRKIAKAFKLTPLVDNTTKVWSEASCFAAGASVWSAVCELAEREGFDARVTPEKELVFKKRVMPSVTSRVVVVPMVTGRWRPERGTISPETLSLYTAKTLALGLKVRCTGYDPRRRRPIVFTAESSLRNRPNYKVVEIVDHTLGSRDLVQARATSALVEISKGLVTGSYSWAVDGEMAPGQAIELRFAGEMDAAFAGRYFVTKVVHELIPEGKFTTAVDFASRPLVDAHTEEEDRQTGGKDYTW